MRENLIYYEVSTWNQIHFEKVDEGKQNETLKDSIKYQQISYLAIYLSILGNMCACINKDLDSNIVLFDKMYDSLSSVEQDDSVLTK